MPELEKLIWTMGGTVLMALITIGFGLFAFYHNISQKLDKGRIDNLARDQQAVQDRLDEALRIVHIGALSGGTSQYLSRIMLVITGLVGMMAKGTSSTDKMQTLANQVSEEALEGLRITDQLQQFAHAGKIRLDELSIKDVLDIASAQGALHNVILDDEGRNLASHPGKILGNAQFLGRLFAMLLENASDATTDADSIRIEVVLEGSEYFVVRVADTGYGMDEDTQQQATDPFFTTKKRADRLGLGLSFALTLVKIHNGSMEIKSRPGKGCDVELKFPLATNASLRENAIKEFGIEDVTDRPLMSLEQELNLLRQEVAQA